MLRTQLADPCKRTKQEERKLALSPLQLMQKFYRSYNTNKSLHHEDSTRRQAATNPICKYEKIKSNSTHKMTNFLNNYERTHAPSQISTDSNPQPHKRFLTSLTPQRLGNARSTTIQDEKRCYFKNVYSESHPLLVTEHKIKTKQIQPLRKMTTEPAVSLDPNIYDSSIKSNQLTSPSQRRDKVVEIKEKMIRIKHLKREKMEKIRYNYLVNNCFKAHIRQEPLKIASKPHPESYVKTRESIFPSALELMKSESQPPYGEDYGE